MRHQARRLFAVGFVTLVVGLVSGCSSNTLADQARSSLSSFITGVVNNTITDVINGNN